MKNTLLALLGFILLSTPLAATAQYYDGAFYYTVTYSPRGGNVIAVTIAGYTGNGGAVNIPEYLFGVPGSATGVPVTAIGNGAFQQASINSVTIPPSVASIGDYAFMDCASLIEIIVYPANPSYSSSGGVLFNKSRTTLIQCPGGKPGSYAIPGSVTNIGDGAFDGCASLTNVTIPSSVTYIADYAFYNCTSLQGVFFAGNTPGDGGNVFSGPNNAIVYYLPGTTGWGVTFAGRPTRLWNPLMQASGPGFGVGPAGFGFNITGTADIPIVVEAATNLANATWVPLQSLALTNGAFYFSDPNWTNHPARNYRIRSP
jgi:hypothetical protein